MEEMPTLRRLRRWPAASIELFETLPPYRSQAALTTRAGQREVITGLHFN